MTPTMTEREQACLVRYLAKSKRYLEYGCGYSTLVACQSNAHVTSIESSPEWAAKVASEPPVRDAQNAGRAIISHIDIGPVGQLGHPSEKNADRWGPYVYSPWEHESYDLVLVDGRFRIACALISALKAPNAVILFHDIWNRPHYHQVLPHLRWLESHDNLGVFRANVTDREAALQLYQRSLSDPH